MSIIKKIVLFIKSSCIKKNNLKTLSEPKAVINQHNNIKFVESLKIPNAPKKSMKKIETLICNGDGLGIQRKITY